MALQLLNGCLSKYIPTTSCVRNYSGVDGTLAAMSRTPLDDPRLTTVGLFIEAHDGLQRRLERQLERARPPSGRGSRSCSAWPAPPSGRLRMTDLAAQSTSRQRPHPAVDRLAGAGSSSARPARPTGAAPTRCSPTAAARSSRAPSAATSTSIERGTPGCSTRRARRPSPRSCARCATSVNPGADRRRAATGRAADRPLRPGPTSTGMPLSTALPESGSNEHLVGQQVAVHAGVARRPPPSCDARRSWPQPCGMLTTPGRMRVGDLDRAHAPDPTRDRDPGRARRRRGRAGRRRRGGRAAVQRGLPFTSTSTLCIHELFDRRSRRPTSTKPVVAAAVEAARRRATSARIGSGASSIIPSAVRRHVGQPGLERRRGRRRAGWRAAVEGQARRARRRSPRRRARCAA